MPNFFTTRQLQELLHVDRTTIYRMADDGRIPAVKVGSQWRFPRRSIEGWLQTQSASSHQGANPANGTHDTEVEKLLPVECVQKIQDTFADLLGVMIVITDLSGQPMTAVSHPCGFYLLTETSPQARRQCEADWAALAKHPSLQPELMRGHLGLLQARGLVRVGSELKAMVMIGGIAPKQWPPDEREIARLAEYLDVTEDVVRTHVSEVFTLTPTQQQQVLSYVQRIADIVAHIITERNVLFGKLSSIAELSRI